jgi:hypothetical protein
VSSSGLTARPGGSWHSFATVFYLLDQKNTTSRGTGRCCLPLAIAQAHPWAFRNMYTDRANPALPRPGAEDTGCSTHAPAACPMLGSCWDQPYRGPNACVGHLLQPFKPPSYQS